MFGAGECHVFVFEGLGLQNCLAGLQNVLCLMRLPASLLKAVSHQTLALKTLMRDFWSKSRAKYVLSRLDE